MGWLALWSKEKSFEVDDAKKIEAGRSDCGATRDNG